MTYGITVACEAEAFKVKPASQEFEDQCIDDIDEAAMSGVILQATRDRSAHERAADCSPRECEIFTGRSPTPW